MAAADVLAVAVAGAAASAALADAAASAALDDAAVKPDSAPVG